MARILVVEDETSLRSTIRRNLELDGYQGAEAGCVREALEALQSTDFDVLIVDLNLVGESGMDLIKQVRADGYEGLIVVVTAHGTIDTAVEALKSGADEFIQKPLRLEELSLQIARGLEMRRVRARLDLHQRIQRVNAVTGDLLGRSEPWLKTLTLARRFASIPVPREGGTELPTILLLGETGVGKGILAQYIQQSDPAFDASDPPPFVHVNCAALPANLIESELFGHEKGAFTDAKAGKPGLFELAEGGTIFLDEIGELAIEMQSKLLLVVEKGIYRRIGGSKERRVRTRVIAATNQDLDERVRAGSFRQDLLFRLNALTIRIPPLRERGDDAVLIAESTLKRMAAQFGRTDLSLSDDARSAIRAHGWPGNARELLNTIRRAVILCDESLVMSEHLGLGIVSGLIHENTPGQVATNGTGGGAIGFDFSQGPVTFDSVERSLILASLRHARGNVSLAAKMIGLNRGALRYRIERLGLDTQIKELVMR